MPYYINTSNLPVIEKKIIYRIVGDYKGNYHFSRSLYRFPVGKPIDLEHMGIYFLNK